MIRIPLYDIVDISPYHAKSSGSDTSLDMIRTFFSDVDCVRQKETFVAWKLYKNPHLSELEISPELNRPQGTCVKVVGWDPGPAGGGDQVLPPALVRNRNKQTNKPRGDANRG